MTDAAERFFDALGLESAPGELVVWTKKGDEKRSRWFESLPDAITYARAEARDRDVYFTVATHGRTPKTDRGSIESAAALLSLWADIDVREGKHASREDLPTQATAEKLLAALPLPPSALVWSGGGFHAYWILREPFAIVTPADRATAKRLSEGWQEFVRQRFAPYKIDATADLARILRVPGTANWKSGSPVPVELTTLTDARYNPDDFEPYLAATPAAETPRKGRVVVSETIPRGEHHNGLRDRAAKLAREGIKPSTVVATLRALIQDGILEGGEDPGDPFTDADLYELARSGFARFGRDPGPDPDARGDANEDAETVLPRGAGSSDTWPTLDSAALHGLAGDVVRIIDPHTEADPVAVLVQFLVMFGNAVGPSPFFQVGADFHRANLFALIVGATAKGRKGTSEGQARRLFKEADPVWTASRVLHGLSSGEGLVYALRDPGEPEESVDQTKADKRLGIVTDRRLLIVESEFASTLKVMARDGNNLSPIIRQLWDHGDLGVLTRREPLRATGAHGSIIGHITIVELLRRMDETDANNGFANRFLFVLSKRSKILPDGGNLTDTLTAPLSARVSAALDAARRITEVRRDAAANALWHSVYEGLSDGRPGLYGAVTSRAEAQVIRLSLLYAILDGSMLITETHLRAALALWSYSAASVLEIFGDLLGDPVADRILTDLRATPPGLARTEISALFGRNLKGPELERALTLLETAKVAYREKSQGFGGNRTPERWFASAS